ncbi:MAG: HAD-superfamily hydrolase, subfamily variant 3 [Phycisphaerales bacterium]|nr:HAD-superfamily hydrolase, subfamily variant 3 [Phycisphaerales bacterium]
MAPMALDGMIFDLDGTIIDSNSLHVEAWRMAFEELGYKIFPDRIWLEVGKGGDKLVPSILGKTADELDGDGLRKRHTEHYLQMAKEQGIAVYPGALELLSALRVRGIKTVLGTSSSKRELKASAQAAGLEPAQLFDAVVTSDDAGESKPEPDVVAASVDKLGMSPAQCAMVGDTPYDAESAKRAGVICLGLLTAGRTPEELLSSGARRTWADIADLGAHLDEALQVASPGPAHLTRAVTEALMREALAAAREGMAAGEVPIGAALARGDGDVIARGFNQLNATKNPTAHAEIVTFARAAGKVPPESRDLILVSTLEPCVMCLGAAMESAVDTVLYGLKAPADSGTRRVVPPQTPESQMPRIVGGILADESRGLFKEWLKKPGRNPQQVRFVEQLLRLT